MLAEQPIHSHSLAAAGARPRGCTPTPRQDGSPHILKRLDFPATTGVALLVYEKLGLGVLRRAWVNLDLVWAAAVVAAGVTTLFT